MWPRKSDGKSKEQILNESLLNNLHSFIVKYRALNKTSTVTQLVDFYTELNKQFSNPDSSITTKINTVSESVEKKTSDSSV